MTTSETYTVRSSLAELLIQDATRRGFPWSHCYRKQLEIVVTIDDQNEARIYTIFDGKIQIPNTPA